MCNPQLLAFKSGVGLACPLKPQIEPLYTPLDVLKIFKTGWHALLNKLVCAWRRPAKLANAVRLQRFVKKVLAGAPVRVTAPGPRNDY